MKKLKIFENDISYDTLKKIDIYNKLKKKDFDMANNKDYI